MDSFRIRLYKDSDYEVVRDIFIRGILEHTSTAFYHTLSLSYIWPLLLAAFLIPLQATGSYFPSIVAVSISITVLWFMSRHSYASYVANSLADDMVDIRKYYLERDGYCFWVAESAGEIAGIIAVVPPHTPTGGNQVELKRMSISIKHRGKGIAKALCRTVIDYARKRGCDAVVLSTSMFQAEARNLYKKLGFRRTGTSYGPCTIAKFVDFRLVYYRYDISIAT